MWRQARQTETGWRQIWIDGKDPNGKLMRGTFYRYVLLKPVVVDASRNRQGRLPNNPGAVSNNPGAASKNQKIRARGPNILAQWPIWGKKRKKNSLLKFIISILRNREGSHRGQWNSIGGNSTDESYTCTDHGFIWCWGRYVCCSYNVVSTCVWQACLACSNHGIIGPSGVTVFRAVQGMSVSGRTTKQIC